MGLIDSLNTALDSWREVAGNVNPDVALWNEDDHKSSDTNIARMRAKFYGGKYIANRPALQYALNCRRLALTPRARPSESPVGFNQGQTTARSNDMGPPPVIDNYIMQAAERCVEAAIRSTTAFDDVRGRLVVTNIFGTAHAQFGNMLVLAATFSSDVPELSELISEQHLASLFDRTIEFLRFSEHVSPTLKEDLRILRYVKDQVLPNRAMTTSFSSAS